jgi:hypothetical protein
MGQGHIFLSMMPWDVMEVVDAAGDGDGSLLLEVVLLRRRLEQRH